MWKTFFTVGGKVTPNCQRQIEDVIFSCGMSLPSLRLFAAGHLNCLSPIEKPLKEAPLFKRKSTSEQNPGPSKQSLSSSKKSFEQTKNFVGENFCHLSKISSLP